MKKYYIFQLIGGDKYYNITLGKDSYVDAVEHIVSRWAKDEEYGREKEVYSIVKVLDTFHPIDYYHENKTDKL